MHSPARRHRFIVSEASDGKRLDQILALHVPGLSRRKARALIEIGGAYIDGSRVKVAGRLVRTGAAVMAVIGPAFERASKNIGQRARGRDHTKLVEPRIAHIDDDLVVVEKPAGLLTAPTPESDRNNLARLVAEKLGGPIYVVHRLDLPTSGLLVLARTDLANRALSELFRVHDVERSYLAVLGGTLGADNLVVTEPLSGKSAETRIEVIGHIGDVATFVRCTLTTGRTHQIRLHAQQLGHPVMGDPQYGKPSPHAPPRMALHAAILGFRHPRSGESLRFESAWPEELASWMKTLGVDPSDGRERSPERVC